MVKDEVSVTGWEGKSEDDNDIEHMPTRRPWKGSFTLLTQEIIRMQLDSFQFLARFNSFGDIA